MKRILRDYLFLLVIAGLIVALDQWTKELVRTQLAVGEMWAPWNWLYPYARIIHWTNTGAAFGIFQNMNIVFTVLAFIVSGAILYYFPHVPVEDWSLRLALCLQLAGAVGNLIDRLTQGYVTDFISLGNFAVFNVADSSISLGVAVLILALWIKDVKKPQPQPAGSEPPGLETPLQPPAASLPPEPAPQPQPEELKGE